MQLLNFLSSNIFVIAVIFLLLVCAIFFNGFIRKRFQEELERQTLAMEEVADEELPQAQDGEGQPGLGGSAMAQTLADQAKQVAELEQLLAEAQQKILGLETKICTYKTYIGKLETGRMSVFDQLNSAVGKLNHLQAVCVMEREANAGKEAVEQSGQVSNPEIIG